MSAPRRLCYICEATEGGVRKHVRELLRVFLRAEENFEILGIFGDREEQGFRSEIDALASRHTNFRFRFVPELRRALRPWNDLRAYGQVKTLLRDFAPQIVHTHSSKAGFIGRMAAGALRIPKIIHTPHVFPFQWTTGAMASLYLALERRAAARATAIVCVSESQRDQALQLKLCDAAKLVVIHNAVESTDALRGSGREAARRRLGLDVDAKVVGMVARLAPQKGVGKFLQAAALLLAKHPHTTFVLVGGGPLEQELRTRLDHLEIQPGRFRLEGHREDARELYPAFDVLVLSSLYEGLPYVLLEAMALGVPVVATDVLGSRDVVVDGETGLLARVNEPEHIAAQIEKLLDEPELRTRFARASMDRVRTVFSFDEFVNRHRALYSANGGEC